MQTIADAKYIGELPKDGEWRISPPIDGRCIAVDITHKNASYIIDDVLGVIELVMVAAQRGPLILDQRKFYSNV